MEGNLSRRGKTLTINQGRQGSLAVEGNLSSEMPRSTSLASKDKMEINIKMETSRSNSYHIDRRVGQQGSRPSVGNQAEVEKLATGTQSSQDFTVVHNSANQFENLQSSTTDNNIWSEEEKKRLVEIDLEERRKGRGFMARLKRRWCREFPNKTNYTEKNLRNNANRFKQEEEIIEWLKSKDVSNGNAGEVVVVVQEGKRNLEWSLQLKKSLIELETEARVLGRGYMKRLKEKWDEKHLEYKNITAQCLRDNAGRFRKDLVLQNLMLVQTQEMQQDQAGKIQQQSGSNPVEIEETEVPEEQGITGTGDREIPQDVTGGETQEEGTERESS